MAATDAAAFSAAKYLQVQTTTDSRAEAVDLARAAVEARLAACGQVAGPIASTYWWNDEVERAEEWLVFFKLPADRYEALAAFLAERHSYDEPEILATPFVAGSAPFLGWLTEETRPVGVPRQRQPGVSEPGVSEPGVSEPGVSEPGAGPPGAGAPSVSDSAGRSS